MTEIWKDIPDYEGIYKVSNLGRVFSYKSNKYLSSGTNVCYKAVTLFKDGKSKCFKVHRLVAEAFIPNPDNKPQVHHIDHDPHNNRVDNLAWVTSYENYFEYVHSEKFKQACEKLRKPRKN